jgi:predicted O-methyltransferase YrrM
MKSEEQYTAEIHESHEALKNIIFEARKNSNANAAHLLTYGAAPKISAKKLKDAVIHPDRFEMLKHLPKKGIWTEVGVLYGDYSRLIMRDVKPKKLHLLDVNFERLNRSKLETHIEDGRIELHAGRSATVIKSFPDRYFDVMYIDADHTYVGVKKDINSARSKIKKGGLIIFNDFANWAVGAMEPYGVYKAACEYIEETNCRVAHLALDPNCFHDLAVQVLE